jgi:hypothetical protein
MKKLLLLFLVLPVFPNIDVNKIKGTVCQLFLEDKK